MFFILINNDFVQWISLVLSLLCLIAIADQMLSSYSEKMQMIEEAAILHSRDTGTPLEQSMIIMKHQFTGK